MKAQISDETLLKLSDAAVGTAFRSYVERAVSILFRSAQYMTSRLLTDCVTLNILLNDKITETSADEIIRCIKRANKSFYTSVESAFIAIEDKFDSHARSVVKDYDKLKNSEMRLANLIVYAISLYTVNEYGDRLNDNEIFMQAYGYAEYNPNELPRYK